MLVNVCVDNFVPSADVEDFTVRLPHVSRNIVDDVGHLVTVEYPNHIYRVVHRLHLPVELLPTECRREPVASYR
ncbi:hypothetical protein MUBE_14320 [Mycobacterium uberis]|uniref:Uncharacterized protein n=1 Tax=Mycobacterium uberis TaxID=2162698 RepID=A0A3E1HCD0_9MYCO|nr:hypothetical protein [Mycobacterium uberis]RFD24070.1 hypothetical protein MUBE_14320 [Mycobacterium uberis]